MLGGRTHNARFGDSFRLKCAFQRCLIAFLSLICLNDATAQKKDCPYFLEIRLISASTQMLIPQIDRPIEGVEIFVEKSHSISHTDAEGWALIRGLCDSISEVEIHVADKHYHLALRCKSPINDTTVDSTPTRLGPPSST